MSVTQTSIAARQTAASELESSLVALKQVVASCDASVVARSTMHQGEAGLANQAAGQALHESFMIFEADLNKHIETVHDNTQSYQADEHDGTDVFHTVLSSLSNLGQTG